MRFKKVMATIVCAAMAGTLLAGCGGKDNASGGNADSSNANSSNENSSSANSSNASSGGTSQAENVSQSEAGGTDLSEHVTLSFYLYGSPGVANADILKEINNKLTADINTSIEVKWTRPPTPPCRP